MFLAPNDLDLKNDTWEGQKNYTNSIKKLTYELIEKKPLKNKHGLLGSICCMEFSSLSAFFLVVQSINCIQTGNHNNFPKSASSSFLLSIIHIALRLHVVKANTRRHARASALTSFESPLFSTRSGFKEALHQFQQFSIIQFDVLHC